MPPPPDLRALRPAQAAGLSDDTLEEVNRLWTVVRAFSNTAHDVNNALQVMSGSAELLEAGDLDPAVRRRVEIIRIESVKAAATIKGLLSYARAPRQAAQRLDVRVLVDNAVGMRLASVGRGRIALSVDRDGSSPAWVEGDPPKILQMLIDLLLVAEDLVIGRCDARIVVRVHSGQDVRVEVASDFDRAGDGVESRREAIADAAELTHGAQLWAASHLAARQGAQIDVDGGTFTLRWPPATT